MGIRGIQYNRKKFSLEAFKFGIYIFGLNYIIFSFTHLDLLLGPIILTWYASKPENMEKNRQFLKKAFQIEMKYPSTSPAEKSITELYEAKFQKEEEGKTG
jgi:hypothetical protein